MNVEIINKKLAKRYEKGTLGKVYGPVIAAAFDDLVALILSVGTANELYNFKGARPEQLQGRPESSMRLNNKMRLIYTLGVVTIRWQGMEYDIPTLFIEGVEDYH